MKFWIWPFGRSKQSRDMLPPPQPCFFGKTPAYTDFLCRGLPHQFVEKWEIWLREGLAGGKDRQGESWSSAYLSAPYWHFAIPPGVCGSKAWVGVLAFSTDQVERKFPFTLVMEWPQIYFPGGLPSLGAWQERAVHLMSKLINESWSLDKIEAGLAALDLPSETMSLNKENTWPDGSFFFHIDSGRLISSSTWPYFSLDFLAMIPADHSVWWTLGRGQILPSILFCPALPSTEGFQALIDGQWLRHGWKEFPCSETVGVFDNGSPIVSQEASFTDSGVHASLDDADDASTQVDDSDDLFWSSEGLSHAGNIRTVNEDAWLNSPEQGLWVVADGMGGHDAGEVASGLIVSSLDNSEPMSSLNAFIECFEERLTQVHQKLQFMATERSYRLPPGSTVVALLTVAQEGAFVWAGDSRGYRWRDGELVLLTRDHSRVEDYVREGILSEDEARNHPGKNIMAIFAHPLEKVKISECL